jgi:hypothetical protein
LADRVVRGQSWCGYEPHDALLPPYDAHAVEGAPVIDKSYAELPVQLRNQSCRAGSAMAVVVGPITPSQPDLRRLLTGSPAIPTETHHHCRSNLVLVPMVDV